MAQVRYIVNDVERAIAFYRDLLGFEVLERFGPAMAILAFDDLRIWLAGPMASASKPMPDGAQPQPGGWNRIVITVSELEETVARLEGAGVTFRNQILAGPGGRQIVCEDPSGNPIELFQPG